MRICLIFISFFVLQGVTVAQSPTFRVEVDALEIQADQYMQVAFVLENAQGKALNPPDFKGWTVLNGPNTSTQVSIVNGVRNSKVSFGYTLVAKSLGELAIGKASIVVDGKTLVTESIKIKVVKSGSKSNPGKDAKKVGNQDIFILAKVTPEKPYVGQQIIVEYKLYTAIDVDNYNITHAPEFKGFHVNHIPRLSYDNQEMINGNRYVTKVIFATALYPIQHGTFEIEPLHVRASVVTSSTEDANSFFLLPTTEGVNLKTPPLSIQVRSLPTPPENFSGAVGKFKMATEVDQLAVKVNDAITMTVFIEGDGDLNRVGKPILRLDSNSFQLYEPKMTKEHVDFKTTGFVGMRELIYPVVALAPGNHEITPTFIYFDTDSQRYVTLSSDLYHLVVSGNKATVSPEQSKDTGANSNAILPLIQDPKLSRSDFIGSWIYYFLLSIPFVAWIASTWTYRRKRNVELRSKNQRQLNLLKAESLKSIEDLDQNNSDRNTKATIDALHSTLTKYLQVKWSLSDQVITKKEWETLLSTVTVDPLTKQKILSFFEDAELSLYGGQMPNAKLLEVISKVKEIIIEV